MNTQEYEAELARLRAVAWVFLRNWHLVARPEHTHELVEDCQEPLFIRMKDQIRGSADV